MTSRLPLFVFGTLRRGEPNHHYLAGRYDRWLPAVLDGFRRSVAAHGYPTILRADGERVAGELFFLAEASYDQTLRGCDVLEDIPEGRLSGIYYRKGTVTVETAEGRHEAWVYMDANTT